MITCRYKTGHAGPCEFVNAQGMYPRAFDQCVRDRTPEELLGEHKRWLEATRKRNESVERWIKNARRFNGEVGE